MQHTLTYPPLGSSDLEPNPTFNVVIAYEDFDTGTHAKKTYDFLVENLGHDCQFINQMWKFDVLSIPKLREIAAKDAIQADIILISSHGGSELPGHVKKWLETWASEGSQALALVALFDCPREEAERTRPIRTYLSALAKRAKLEFFAQPDDWPGHKRDESLLGFQRSSRLNEKTLCTLAGVVQRDVSVPRWSIND